MKTLKFGSAAQAQAVSGRSQSDHRVFRTQVAVGDVIHFAPTGEELRVKKIDKGRIVFEKRP